MPKRTKYKLIFAPEVVDHLDGIERKYHRQIMEAIDEHLSSNPDQETHNRKPLEQPTPFGTTWEIRCGPNNRFRVLYGVESDEPSVHVLAIGIKEGNKLTVGGEECEL